MKAPKTCAQQPGSWLDSHDDRLLSSREAARFLSVHPHTLRKWRQNSVGPAWVVFANGTTLRYRLGELKKFANIKGQAA